MGQHGRANRDGCIRRCERSSCFHAPRIANHTVRTLEACTVRIGAAWTCKQGWVHSQVRKTNQLPSISTTIGRFTGVRPPNAPCPAYSVGGPWPPPRQATKPELDFSVPSRFFLAFFSHVSCQSSTCNQRKKLKLSQKGAKQHFPSNAWTNYFYKLLGALKEIV